MTMNKKDLMPIQIDPNNLVDSDPNIKGYSGFKGGLMTDEDLGLPTPTINPENLVDSDPNEDYRIKDKIIAGATGIGQGLSMGFGDEIIAGGKSLYYNTPYDSELKLIRKKIADIRDKDPGYYYTGDIAGSLLPSVLTRGKSPVLAGTISGAIRGAGDSEDISSTPLDVLKGASIGGIAGGIAGNLGSAGDILKNKIAPGIERSLSELGKGMTNRANPFIGGSLSVLKDGIVNKLISRGMTPDIAEQVANKYLGKTSLATGLHATPLSSPGALAVANADLLAKGAGNVLSASGKISKPLSSGIASFTASSPIPDDKYVKLGKATGEDTTSDDFNDMHEFNVRVNPKPTYNQAVEALESISPFRKFNKVPPIALQNPNNFIAGIQDKRIQSALQAGLNESPEKYRSYLFAMASSPKYRQHLKQNEPFFEEK